MEAWRKFKESQFEFLLVMEADATWVESESPRLLRTMESLVHGDPLYLNIGGGFDIKTLEVESLIIQRQTYEEGGVLTSSKPFTNTTCAYILNRPLVEILLDKIEDYSAKSWRTLAIDWLLNGLFLQVEGKGVNITCGHFCPPLLNHGSMTGSFKGWRADRLP